MIAIRFDDVVRSAVRALVPMYPQRSLPDLFDSVTESLEVAASAGLVRLVGPWVVVG